MSAIGDKPNQLVVHGMLGSAAYFDVKDLPTSSATQNQIDEAISNLATVASTGKYTDLTDVPTTFPPAAHSHPIGDVTGLQSALDSKAASTTTISAGTGISGGGTLAANRSIALNAASIASLAKADTALQPITGQGLYPDVDQTKLAGVATGATKNATDAQLRARSSHTGTQAISTVVGLQTALDSKVASVQGKSGAVDLQRTDFSWMGTAATKDVGEDTENVMQVGAFGLGSSSSNPLPKTGGAAESVQTGFYTGPGDGSTGYPDQFQYGNFLMMNRTGVNVGIAIRQHTTQGLKLGIITKPSGVAAYEFTTIHHSENLPTATQAELRTGTQTAPRIYAPKTFYDAAAFVALTSAATITPNLNSANNFTLTLAHNATLANPTGAKSGQSGTIYITHTGTNTLSFGDNWEFIGGVPELGDGTNADVITYQVVSPSVVLASFGSVE